jgi:hypothetical protein
MTLINGELKLYDPQFHFTVLGKGKYTYLFLCHWHKPYFSLAATSSVLPATYQNRFSFKPPSESLSIPLSCTFLPARTPIRMKKRFQKIPRWNIDILKLSIVCLCWFSKLNSDWLLEAMPLKFGYPIIPIFH